MFISEKHFSGLEIINYFIMCSTDLALPKISLFNDKNAAFELKNHFWPAPSVIPLEKKKKEFLVKYLCSLNSTSWMQQNVNCT